MINNIIHLMADKKKSSSEITVNLIYCHSITLNLKYSLSIKKKVIEQQINQFSFHFCIKSARETRQMEKNIIIMIS